MDADLHAREHEIVELELAELHVRQPRQAHLGEQSPGLQ